MKLIPKTREDWKSIIDTTFKGNALILDTLCTYGVAKFLLELRSRERIKKILNELRNTSEDLKKEIQKKISEDYLNSDKFLVFLNNAFGEALKIKNTEKIKYFRSAIISGIIKPDIEEGKKLLFIDALSNLPLDSTMLLMDIDKMCSKRGNANITVQHIKQRYDYYKDPIYLMANLRSLERYNLVEVITPGVVKDPDYSNYTVIYGSFGRDFILFIMAYQ